MLTRAIALQFCLRAPVGVVTVEVSRVLAFQRPARRKEICLGSGITKYRVRNLSPPAFRRETDLTGGDRYAVAKLAPKLPWEVGRDGRKNSRLYYQVVLGTIKLDAAVASLITKFGDTRAERAGARGEAILATIMLDRNGKPIEEPAVSISSFAWGVPKALHGDLYKLSDWQIAEGVLVEKLDRLIRLRLCNAGRKPERRFSQPLRGVVSLALN